MMRSERVCQQNCECGDVPDNVPLLFKSHKAIACRKSRGPVFDDLALRDFAKIGKDMPQLFFINKAAQIADVKRLRKIWLHCPAGWNRHSRWCSNLRNSWNNLWVSIWKTGQRHVGTLHKKTSPQHDYPWQTQNTSHAHELTCHSKYEALYVTEYLNVSYLAWTSQTLPWPEDVMTCLADARACMNRMNQRGAKFEPSWAFDKKFKVCHQYSWPKDPSWRLWCMTLIGKLYSGIRDEAVQTVWKQYRLYRHMCTLKFEIFRPYSQHDSEDTMDRSWQAPNRPHAWRGVSTLWLNLVGLEWHAVWQCTWVLLGLKCRARKLERLSNCRRSWSTEADIGLVGKEELGLVIGPKSGPKSCKP